MAEKNKAGSVVVLAGPTASGKSALALDLAEALGGTIINADSMQVYRDLPILSAQPDATDMARAPHRLYGFLALDDACDAQRWAELAAQEIDAAHAEGRVPIIVGGTGLYIRSLVSGFSPLPDIPAEVRSAARALVKEAGAEEAHRRLTARDPETAARLRPTDPQRIARAWEVLEATGQPLSWWQAQPPVPPTPHRFQAFAITPERAELYTAADARFLAMLERGALEEVSRAAALAPFSDGGGRKALGYAELAAVSAGTLSLSEAIPAAQQATRRYAKRQLTWFRHQLPQANFISPDNRAMKFSQSYTAQLRQKIRDFLLTP
ncbi:tRNA (adenosine(37)-N6)-dimethylallyltransferase MiaA [Dongia sp.]|uniref:tRNA (adenosine(37)-N6)-dimethylallyltransferase MiaA n=1 Tax=Dongia sp. TaxID=1977262 RepID=UPI0035AE3927